MDAINDLPREQAIQLFRLMRASAIRIQAAVRGMLAKKKLAVLKYNESQDWIHSRATRLAAIWKGHRDQLRYRVMLAAKHAREQEERQHRAAVQIQKCCRAFLTRVRYLARLKGRNLDPRLRRHVEKYITKGDIWTVLKRVDLDFRFIDSEYREEEDNVRTFIKDVLEKRENDMRYLTLDFRHAVDTNETAQKARSLANSKISDFDRLAIQAAPSVESMVERDQRKAAKLAASKMRYLESLQPKTAEMSGASVQLDSGAMKDDSPFEVRSLDGPVHPLIMLGVALTYPPDGGSGRAAVESWLKSSLDLEKVQHRELIRQRAAPYVETLRTAGVHTVRDLQNVSLLAHGFPLPLRDTIRRELRRVQWEEQHKKEEEAAQQARLGREAKKRAQKLQRQGVAAGVSAASSFVIPKGLLRSERQLYAPKNFVGKLVKPTRARQQALAWLKKLDTSYGVSHLDDPHDKFITYVFLRFLSKQELEDFEYAMKEKEAQRTRDTKPIRVDPEVGDTFIDFLQNLVQKDDLDYRREAMARRSKRAFHCAEETILLLKQNGYETVRSLLLCPMEALGVEREPAAEIALGIKKLSKANPWLLTKFKAVDTRYQRTASDVAVVPSDQKLPPLIVPSSLVDQSKVRLRGGAKRVRQRMKAINAERPHPRNVTAYDGAKSTAKAFVRLKAQALLEMSYEHQDGRDYHKWKNDEKLTEAVMRRRQQEQLDKLRAEQHKERLAREATSQTSRFASLVPTEKILHPLERMEADAHWQSLWPPEFHDVMRASTKFNEDR